MLQRLDNRLVFVWENQGVWVAATERKGDDPPVCITEECSHWETQQVVRLSSRTHFCTHDDLPSLSVVEGEPSVVTPTG